MWEKSLGDVLTIYKLLTGAFSVWLHFIHRLHLRHIIYYCSQTQSGGRHESFLMNGKNELAFEIEWKLMTTEK